MRGEDINDEQHQIKNHNSINFEKVTTKQRAQNNENWEEADTQEVATTHDAVARRPFMLSD